MMDAISFVLGVKSSQLRSTQLKDLVYRSGETRNKDPVECLVTAVYEQSDGSIIRFTRTVNANGTSDYRIGHKTVSFAAYLQVLEKESILVKARNFLVFQGDVETIASQSPKDLTRLIEHISGSLDLKGEYERLKSAQELASEQSALSFTKKKSISAELKQFREQKQEADRFNDLTKQRDKLIRIHSLWKLFHLDKKMEKAQLAIKSHSKASASFNESQQQALALVKTETRAQAKAQKEVMRLERNLKLNEKALDDLKPDVLRIEEKMKHCVQKLENATKSKTDAQTEYERQSELVKLLKTDSNRLSKAFEQFEAQTLQDAEKAGKSLGESQVIEYNKLREQADAQTSSERQSLLLLNVQLQTASESCVRLEEKLSDEQNRDALLAEDSRAVNERREKLLSVIEQNNLELKNARGLLAQRDIEIRRLTQEEGEIQEKLTEVSNRLLQARVDRQESERSKKFRETLSALKRLFPGVHGRLIDLCQTTQKKYNHAVTIVLGKNMDAIVVDSQKVAVQCIKYMREQRSGQATFLPLDTLQVKPINETYRSLAKGARLAMDVMQFEPIAEKAVQYACGSSLICDGLDIARYICYERNQEVKAVTLDGTVIHKTGMITGGESESADGGRRWEEKEVQELKNSQERLTLRLDEINKVRRKAAHDDHIRSDIAGCHSRLMSMKDELAQMDMRLKSLATERANVKQTMAGISAELKQAKASEAEIARQIEQIDSVVRKAEKNIFKDFCKRIKVHDIRDYEKSLLNTSREVSEKRLRFTTQMARLDNQLVFERQRLDEVKQRIERIDGILGSDDEGKAELEAKKKAIQNDVGRIEALRSSLEAELNKAKQDLNTQSNALGQAKKKLSDLVEANGKASNVLADTETDIEKFVAEKMLVLRKCKMEEVNLPLLKGSLEDVSLDALNWETDLNAMDVDQENFDPDKPGSSQQNPKGKKTSQKAGIDKLQIDYSLLKRSLRENGGSETEAEILQEVNGLSVEIERIAPTLRAIDRMDDVENKLRQTSDEFEKARQDAKDAKERFEIIKAKRHELFYSAYSHIESVIDGIYKELTISPSFPVGGTAYLSLGDSEEPYLDGVKYHAMPPMKRFREMELLSGGEKTVAALALLFAIHSYVPAPFFVLDEVDAALDNTNVARVTEYIRNHSRDEAQFIVISLKPRFYEKAESLVGIYPDAALKSSRTLTLDLTRFEE